MIRMLFLIGLFASGIQALAQPLRIAVGIDLSCTGIGCREFEVALRERLRQLPEVDIVPVGSAEYVVEPVGVSNSEQMAMSVVIAGLMYRGWVERTFDEWLEAIGRRESLTEEARALCESPFPPPPPNPDLMTRVTHRVEVVRRGLEASLGRGIGDSFLLDVVEPKREADATRRR